jgi:hypothetical protein
MSVEAGYVGNRERTPGAARRSTSTILRWSVIRPCLATSGDPTSAHWLTQESISSAAALTTGTTSTDQVGKGGSRPSCRRFSPGGSASGLSEYFVHDATLNRGPADWDRTHSFVLSQLAELPFGKGRMTDALGSPICWRLADQLEHDPERNAFNVERGPDDRDVDRTVPT